MTILENKLTLIPTQKKILLLAEANTRKIKKMQ